MPKLPDRTNPDPAVLYTLQRGGEFGAEFLVEPGQNVEYQIAVDVDVPDFYGGTHTEKRIIARFESRGGARFVGVQDAETGNGP